MTDQAPLERAQQEYGKLLLPPAVHDRILCHVFERTQHPSTRWAPGIAVGFAAGCVAMAALFAFERWKATPDPVVSEAAVARDVRGLVQSEAEDPGEATQVESQQRILAGSWLQTHHEASLEVAVGPHRASVAGGTRIQLQSLRNDRLAFSLDRGSARFEVEPLSHGETLSVRSGELLVEVIGTAFAVARSDGCSDLLVTKGRVRATFRQAIDLVSAGESKRYCEKHDVAPLASGAAVPVQTAPNAAAEVVSTPTVSAQRQSVPEGQASASARFLTDEEQGFRHGIDALRSGTPVSAHESFESYLRTYPRGTFSQDARFHLVRLVYAQGNVARTVALGQEFLAQEGDGGVRGNEVRLLMAQSLLQQGLAADRAFALLSPLVEASAVSTGAHTEQIVYLYILAASRCGKNDDAHTWAERYLDRYPTGRYRSEVERIVRP